MSMIQDTRAPAALSVWGLFWLLVATVAAGLFFIDGLDALLVAWQLPEYSHGPLIPVLSALLFVRQLKEYPADPGPKRDRWPGVLLLVVAILFGALGKLANIDDIVAYATILWVGAILLISFGWKTGKHFWPPVLHLVYMLPLPGVLYFKLSTVLQFISSELGVWFLQLLNVPVFLEGNIIDLGVLKLQVAEACSGLRYLFPILSFSYIFAVLYKGPMWHKAVLLISAVPITVLMVLGAANLFRTRIGRAFIAIRDRDISAEVLGISLLRYKLMSFAISSFYAGVAGGMWAYFFRVVTPESFPFVYSIFFLAAIIVGGMGTILGAILGAVFMTLVPELLRFGIDWLTPVLPNAAAMLSPVRTIVFGLLIVGFLIFEPKGLAEIVQRTRRYFHLWPFKK